MKEGLLWRTMQDADLATVLTIETSGQLVPWSRLAFEQSLSNQHVCRVGCAANELIAFHISHLVLDELHILNLGVGNAHRGHGYGHDAMSDVFDVAKQHQCTALFLEVRQSNQTAIALYEKWGFEHTALRKNYYRLPNGSDKETALIFSRKLNPE